MSAQATITDQDVEQLAQILFDEHARCPICHGRGLVDCPRHGDEVVDGWCVVCDTAVDGGPAGWASCPCQAGSVDELYAMVALVWGA